VAGRPRGETATRNFGGKTKKSATWKRQICTGQKMRSRLLKLRCCLARDTVLEFISIPFKVCSLMQLPCSRPSPVFKASGSRLLIPKEFLWFLRSFYFSGLEGRNHDSSSLARFIGTSIATPCFAHTWLLIPKEFLRFLRNSYFSRP